MFPTSAPIENAPIVSGPGAIAAAIRAVNGHRA
jgi:hypothetical protein